MASEELANQFNKILDDGKDVFVVINNDIDVKRINVSQYDDGEYCMTSGALAVWLSDVYMTAKDRTVTLVGCVGNTRAVSRTFRTEQIILQAHGVPSLKE